MRILMYAWYSIASIGRSTNQFWVQMIAFSERMLPSPLAMVIIKYTYYPMFYVQCLSIPCSECDML